MRRFNNILVGLVAVLSAGSAFSQNCSCAGGTRVQPDTAVATLLGGKAVCASIGTNLATQVWQELHAGTTPAGGQLTDLKGNSITNTAAHELVGTWSASGNGANTRVTYNYGTGGTYTYEVCQQGAAVHFCGATNVTNATIITSGSCPAVAAAAAAPAALTARR